MEIVDYQIQVSLGRRAIAVHIKIRVGLTARIVERARAVVYKVVDDHESVQRSDLSVVIYIQCVACILPRRAGDD